MRYRCGSACTTNPCNNLAPRRRVKCANVGDRHESVREPVELQPPPVIKSEERRRGVGLESNSDARQRERAAAAGKRRERERKRRGTEGVVAL